MVWLQHALPVLLFHAVGELWLVAGQSNIAYSLGDLQRKARAPFNQRVGDWLSSTSSHPRLRLFQVKPPQSLCFLAASVLESSEQEIARCAPVLLAPSLH